MANNTNEEQLNTSKDPPSEIHSEEIILTTNPETINPKQETENMEVHHHALHGHEKKTWKNYFWEFLMLFLAVFCGFLAENMREHIVERKREKVYINSMISDLKEDTANLSLAIAGNIERVNGLDTLSTLLNTTHLNDSLQTRLYKLNLKYASNLITTSITERTIKQLLNSGSMRLIHEELISDSIMQYYGRTKDEFSEQQKIYEECMRRVVFYGEDIFDNYFKKLRVASDTSFFIEKRPESIPLLTTEKKMLKKYSSMLITTSGMAANYLYMLMDIRLRAIHLIAFVKKKYDIQ
jgi:hypothetical protein